MNKLFMDWLEVITKFIVIIGVPVGVIKYFISKRKETKDREYLIYDAMDEKYIDFQKLCLQYPLLDVADIPHSPSATQPSATPTPQSKQELIIFIILFSIFERAYILYYNGSSEIKRKQWSGWEEYIDQYCKRNNFKEAWRTAGKTFDTTFQKFMDTKIPPPTP